MSEQFNNKDYGEYFSAIEKSLERKSQPVQKTTPQTEQTKKVYGG